LHPHPPLPVSALANAVTINEDCHHHSPSTVRQWQWLLSTAAIAVIADGSGSRWWLRQWRLCRCR
jgi:hypothetical protein